MKQQQTGYTEWGHREWSYVYVKSILKDGTFAVKKEELGILLPQKHEGHFRVFYINTGEIIEIPSPRYGCHNLIRKK